MPKNLAADFGAKATGLAIEGVHALYDAIGGAKHEAPRFYFKQWRANFGEVCGYDLDNPSDAMKELAMRYGISGKLRPAHLLFALHTYYAIFTKLLATEVVASFHKSVAKSHVQKLLAARTSAKIMRK